MKYYNYIYKHLLIVTLAISVFSCNSNQPDVVRDLNVKITELENENRKLKDSISDFEKQFLYSQILVGIPDTEIIRVGRKNKIVLLFHTFSKELPEYGIYKIDGKKEVKIGTGNTTRFDFEFIPKSVEDNNVNLLVKIPFQKDTIEIPATMMLDIKN
ncbi:MAG: hypothetical protein EOO45_23625 [Flavobacterium sp.]|nr:MAG: hypothetical protein EOO45_23625 [Flavobacterium sp.]